MKRTAKLIGACGLMLLPTLCLAAGESPVGNGLQAVLTMITGTTGITAATLGVAGIGIGCVYGYLEWTRFLQTVIGIAIIFGSSTIVSTLTKGLS